MDAETVKGILVFVIVPLIGIIGYMWLVAKMSFSKIVTPPYVSYFLIFAGYGSLVVTMLVKFILGLSYFAWMSMMGNFTLGLLAMVFVLAINSRLKEQSVYDLWAVRLANAYCLVVILVWLTMAVSER
jgi:hypothetical protein